MLITDFINIFKWTYWKDGGSADKNINNMIKQESKFYIYKKQDLYKLYV